MSNPVWQSITDLLASRALANFVGVREGLFLEVKGSSPYDFTHAEARYELAKDVTALANADGGWLLIGLTTTRLAAEAADEITALDLVAREAFPESQIRGMLKEYVYPGVVNLEMKWLEDVGGDGLGIGVIHVPPQSDDRKPFLIAKVVEEGDHLKQVVFGFAKRVGADSIPYAVDQMHRAMKVGMHSTAQRLTGIDEKLDRLLEAQDTRPSPQLSTDAPKSKLAARIAATLSE